MNNKHCVLPDTQNLHDSRNLEIQWVGIKAYRYPIVFLNHSEHTVHSIGVFDMQVNLPADKKGTHMSRFIAVLNQYPSIEVSFENMERLILEVQSTLEAENACVSVNFPFVLKKHAPVSKQPSLMDYDARYQIECANGKFTHKVTLTVHLTSLCPCSKSISNYGAHNQRSIALIELCMDKSVSFIDIIQSIESLASCDLYAVLKRGDEKYVTEKAYDNPQFVEDMVRNFALFLEKVPNVFDYSVSVENLESIHNHSAYAIIKKPNR